MFDRLIESESADEQVKTRRSYFMVSTVVVGILFLTAVVISLYAQDLDLGVNEFELSQLLPPNIPAEAPEPEPEPQAQVQQTEAAAPTTELPRRQTNTLRIEENPTQAPTGVSVTRSQFLSRPPGSFRIGSGPETNGIGKPGETTIGSNRPVGSSAGRVEEPEPRAAAEKEVPPPPPIAKKEHKPAPTSLGVINGKAKVLPKPPYPPAAVALNVEGDVTVQVTVNEHGRIISARAVNGHPTLRQAAEQAARKAVFEPTTLSEVPVKVTGMIVYKFKRN